MGTPDSCSQSSGFKLTEECIIFKIWRCRDCGAAEEKGKLTPAGLKKVIRLHDYEKILRLGLFIKI